MNDVIQKSYKYVLSCVISVISNEMCFIFNKNDFKNVLSKIFRKSNKTPRSCSIRNTRVIKSNKAHTKKMINFHVFFYPHKILDFKYIFRLLILPGLRTPFLDLPSKLGSKLPQLLRSETFGIS